MSTQIALVYNRYVEDLFTDLGPGWTWEEHDNDPEYLIRCASKSTTHAGLKQAAAPTAGVNTVSAFQIVEGITAERVLASACCRDNEDRYKVQTYVRVLAALCATWTACNKIKDASESIKLVEHVLEQISVMQDGKTVERDPIITDDVWELLCTLKSENDEDDDNENKGTTSSADNGEDDISKIFGGDSQFMNIAKEVANDIDVSKIMSDNDSVPNIGNILQHSGLLTDIVSTVTSKIHDKLNSGELNQQDLIKEAMGVMSSMGGGLGGGGSKRSSSRKRHSHKGGGMPDMSFMMNMMKSFGSLKN
jgi:hypothetical protein